MGRMKKKIKAILGRARSNFFTGIFAFLPIVLTGYLVFILAAKINGLIVSITPKKFYPIITDTTYGGLVRIFILIMLLLFIAIIGGLTNVYIGKQLFRLGEKIIHKIPILNKIYNAIQQISKAFFGQKTGAFKKVVLASYPRPDIYVIGFLTGEFKEETLHGKIGHKLFNIFIPTTPNPTSGMLVMLPEEEFICLDMTIEEAMKLIISAGVVVPEVNNQANS